MKQIQLILLCCLSSLWGYSQQGAQKGEVNTKNFPEVSFIWNEYNPVVVLPNQFVLKENGQELAFEFENLSGSAVPNRNKSILFLIEDQPVRKNQFKFTCSLLWYFLKDDLAHDKTTAFNIAVFNRKQGEASVIKTKLPNFTSDRETLLNFIGILSDDHDNTQFPNPHESDLYIAIKRGLDIAGNEPNKNTRAIIVVTAGKAVPGVEISPIINQSLQNKIPVYVIHCPLSQNERNPTLVQLVRQTYGQLITSSGKDDEKAVKQAREELLNCFNEINRLHYGQDYKITFTSNLKRDGKSYPLAFTSNGTDYNITPYKTPSFSLIEWAKRNLIVFFVLLAVVLVAIILSIIFGAKFYRKWKNETKAKHHEMERQKASQIAEQENLKRKLDATQEEMQRQRKATEEAKKQILDQEQEALLVKLMHTKNLHPRLLVVDEKFTYRINDIVTVIGRLEDCDVVLSHPTVGRRHAQIVFNGYGFQIYDLQSANGTTVNGNAIESAELRNADIIQLGQAVIKFYL